MGNNTSGTSTPIIEQGTCSNTTSTRTRSTTSSFPSAIQMDDDDGDSNTDTNMNASHEINSSQSQFDRLKTKLAATNYRSFVFVVHEETNGMLLLHCTRKVKKGPHYQLPGGHVDMEDLHTVMADISASNCKVDDRAVFVKVCCVAASRELYEETGIDTRALLHRLQPKQLRPHGKDTSISDELVCELKGRCFFSLNINDSDFPRDGTDSYEQTRGDDASACSSVRLNLSKEHSGFMLERNLEKIPKLLSKHSGGKCSDAFRLCIQNDEEINNEQIIPTYFSFANEKT